MQCRSGVFNCPNSTILAETVSNSLELSPRQPMLLPVGSLCAILVQNIPTRRAGANSLNFAILIAIPAILTALSHLLLNILAHQGDSQ